MYTLTNNPEFTTSNMGLFTALGVLSDAEIDYLIKLSHNKDFLTASIYKGDRHSIDLKTRSGDIFWLKPESEDEKIKIIFKKITQKIIEINQKVFHYDLTDIEPIQFTKYNTGDFYTSHVDISEQLLIGNTCRKLSFSIQLNDPSEYNGGDLLAYTSKTPTPACKNKGSMTFFSSYLLHEVKPVTQGVRNALVGWCWGPKFK